jgi:hypothetical protein
MGAWNWQSSAAAEDVRESGELVGSVGSVGLVGLVGPGRQFGPLRRDRVDDVYLIGLSSDR